MTGFVERPGLRELVALGPPVIDDLGSGALDRGRPVLGDEPEVRRSIAAGAALTCFSGDKLLGGPQAGVLVGAAEAVSACRAHPLARALRIDKLCLAGLEATLELHLDPATAGRIPRAGDARAHARAAGSAHRRAGSASPGATWSRCPPRPAAARCRCASCQARPSRCRRARRAPTRSRRGCAVATRRWSPASQDEQVLLSARTLARG